MNESLNNDTKEFDEYINWLNSSKCNELAQAYEQAIYSIQDEDDNTYEEIKTKDIIENKTEYNKLTINLDFDGTIADTNQAICNYYNYKTGASVTTDMIKEFSLIDTLTLWNKEQIDSMFCEEEFFEFIKVFDGAVETIDKLIEEGHNVRIVTCHNPHGIIYKSNWITKYLRNIQQVIYIVNRNGVKMDKSAVCGDILLDDNIDNLLSCQVEFPICFNTYNYNKNWDGIRVANWEEFYDFVTMISYTE